MIVVLPLLSMSGICHFTKLEAEKCDKILQKLSLERLDKFDDDVNLLTFQINKFFDSVFFQLDLIILQLYHHTIEFTANGFFDIDLTLIYGMTGAITTYLVILLQFNDSME